LSLTALNNINYFSSSTPNSNISLVESKWKHNTLNENFKQDTKRNLLHGDYKNAKKVKYKIQAINHSNVSSSNQIDEMHFKHDVISNFFHESWHFKARRATTNTRKKQQRAAIVSNAVFVEKKAAASSPKNTSINPAATKKPLSNSSSSSSPFKMIIASSTPSVLFTNLNFIPKTNVIEFKSAAIDENDNGFLKSSINSTQINSREYNYRPEVGIRIALMLGSMMCMIILYLLWRNRCHCLLHRFGLSVNY
jgi:ribosomal protein S18